MIKFFFCAFVDHLRSHKPLRNVCQAADASSKFTQVCQRQSYSDVRTMLQLMVVYQTKNVTVILALTDVNFQL